MGWDESFATRAGGADLTVAIIGLGYVGLPTAIGFHDAGFDVWGVDISEHTIRKVLAGENPTGDPEIDDIIPQPGVERWHITTETHAAVAASDIVIVTVPTPITDDLKPDLRYVASAGRSIFASVRPKSRTVVVLESTVYPSVTADTWYPLLEEAGLEMGVDVEIAYCPERFNPGDSAHSVRNVARVIGCPDPEVGRSLVTFYSRLTSGSVDYVGKIEVAEAAKVIENVQRDINIALVNELARIFPELGVDVEEVLDAAATKWNFHRYTPGVGVGGHCIPVDPYYMIQKAADVGVPAELISAARAVNRSMPNHVAQVIRDRLHAAGIPSRDARVLFLGWSYKPEVGDARETPAEPLAAALRAKGISVSAWDPHVQAHEFPLGINVVEDITKAESNHMVVLVTAHRACMDLDWQALLSRMEYSLLYDGRRVLPLEELSEMGWTCAAVGMPDSELNLNR